MEINVIVIEDEAPAARRLIRLLEQGTRPLKVIKWLDSVESGIDFFENSDLRVDLAFMDVQLGDGTIFELLETVSLKPPIIFTTAYDQYAIKAFKEYAVDYILKPIKVGDLESALDKFFLHFYSPGQEDEDQMRHVIKMGQKQLIVPTSAIAYYYVSEKVVYAVTFEGKRYHLDTTLEKLENQITNDFYRINRQFIIHWKAIKEMKTTTKSRLILTLDPPFDKEVISSTDRSSDFKKWLKSFH